MFHAFQFIPFGDIFRAIILKSETLYDWKSIISISW